MPPQPDPSTPRRLRYQPGDVEEVLNRLDASPANEKRDNARHSDRYDYRINELNVAFEQPGNVKTYHVLPSRNLSRGGVALLCGNFVYTNTRCTVELPTLQGKQVQVTGKVVRCRYVEGSATLHEIGVRFDKPIDVTKYSEQAGKLHFLVVDHDATQTKFLKHVLKTQAIEVVSATELQEAVAMVASGWFDLALVHHDPPEFDGLAIVRALRRAGFARGIVALTPLLDGSIPQACREAGCSTYITKPVNLDDLMQVVGAMQTTPLHSEFHEDPELAELIIQFVTGLPQRLNDLQLALEEQDFAGLQRLLRIVGGEGQAFGFRPIADAASKLERQLSDDDDLFVVQREVNELVKLCNSAKAPEAQ